MVEWELSSKFRVTEGRPLTVATMHWAPGDPLPPPSVRTDLQGTTLRAGVVLTEGDEGRWITQEEKYPQQINFWTKFNYALMQMLASRYKFLLQPVVTDSWGYMHNGSFDGLTALVQRGQVDMGAAGMAIKKSRMPVLRYTAETGLFWPKFLFRQPRLSAVSNIYALPFSRTVWGVYLGSVLALTAVLIATQRILAQWANAPKDEDDPARWIDVPLFACAVLCDEGYPQTPEGLSSRIVLLTLLLLSVFHVTSYSACIVSLLQASSSGYDTLQQLVESPLGMAMQDIPYNVNYGNETGDPLVRRLYHERLPRSRREAFLSLAEGVARVRRGLFAFQADVNALRVVADTFLEEEKCGLKRVAMFPPQAVSVPVPRTSPLREILTLGVRWLRETGLLRREWLRWDSPVPRCADAAASSSFVSVGLVEFRPVLLLFAWGLLVSIALLALEVAVARITGFVVYYQGRLNVHGDKQQTWTPKSLFE